MKFMNQMDFENNMMYDMEEIEQDCAYMKGLCKKSIRMLRREVEEECDKLEYDGSCMFDLYPDRIHLSHFVDHIYCRCKKKGLKHIGECETCEENWVKILIEIMLYDEMQMRRMRYRNRKRYLF